MRLSARLSLAATCCTLVFASACSDSTSPDNSQDAAHLAAHFDSLFVTADAAGFSGRASILSLLEVAPAFGATASNITVTTANGTEQWKGFELEDVLSSGGSATDTSYFVLAYRESDVHTVVLALYGADGSIQAGGILANDTLNVSASDGSGSTSRTSLGTACAQPSSSLQNPDLTALNFLQCNTATFSASMSLVLPSTPNVDAALTSLSFSTSTFKGIRVLETGSTGPGVVRRLRAMLRKAHGGRTL